jgi:DNA-binding XRE family transcriptional regulator
MAERTADMAGQYGRTSGRAVDPASRSDAEWLAEVGRRLRALRKARGLTLQQVAAETGLDRETVGRAERGDNPTLLTLVRLLRSHGRLDALNGFAPAPEISPMRVLESRRRGGEDG